MARLRAMDGQVQCPSRGTINIEVCFGCPRLSRIRQRHGAPLVCCSAALSGHEPSGRFGAVRPGSC